MAEDKQESKNMSTTTPDNVYNIKDNQIKVGDKVLTLKNPGTKWYYQHRDNCSLPGGGLARVDYIQGFLDFVVVHPQLTIEDFGIDELGEFLRQVESFLRRKS